MKILILGEARSGKDTLAEIWNKEFGITFESSSMAAAKLFIYDELKEKYGYTSFEECFEDRMNRRKEWYDLICGYNINDPSKLARHMMQTSDIYVGMRSDVEVLECRDKKVFDLIIWVDAGKRVAPESSESCTVSEEDADITVTNNKSQEEFTKKAITLGKILFNGQR